MVYYTNGNVPIDLLVIFNRGYNDRDGHWYHGFPPATYARHLALIRRAKLRTGRDLALNYGWTAYRPYWAQVMLKGYYTSIGQPQMAATAGTSSHGGVWEGRQTMAGDYSNWYAVYNGFGGRDAFYADCRAVGLSPGLISAARGYPEEPWHVIDLQPWSAVPAFDGVALPFDPRPIPATPIVVPPIQEPDMTLYIRNSARGDYAVQPGVVKHIANPSVLNVLVAANPDAVKVVTVIDENLDSVLDGIGGISPAEIAALPANGMWVAGQLSSNPTLDYGSSRPTQEVVLRSVDTKVSALLGYDQAAAIEARLQDEFAAIPDAVADENARRQAE